MLIELTKAFLWRKCDEKRTKQHVAIVKVWLVSEGVTQISSISMDGSKKETHP